MAGEVDSTELDGAAVLSIGVVFGGPERSAWRESVLALQGKVIEVRDGIESPLNVNVVFHVPGSVLSPDYEGARTGSYRRRDSHLMVQVALPSDVPVDSDAYVVRSLHEVLGAVEQWNLRKDRQFDLSALCRTIDLVSRSV